MNGLKDKNKNKIRNPVAKYSPEFCKPKTYRDRKKHPSDKEQYRDHPLHEPYQRQPKLKKEYLEVEDEYYEDDGYYDEEEAPRDSADTE